MAAIPSDSAGYIVRAFTVTARLPIPVQQAGNKLDLLLTHPWRSAGSMPGVLYVQKTIALSELAPCAVSTAIPFGGSSICFFEFDCIKFTLAEFQSQFLDREKGFKLLLDDGLFDQLVFHILTEFPIPCQTINLEAILSLRFSRSAFASSRDKYAPSLLFWALSDISM